MGPVRLTIVLTGAVLLCSCGGEPRGHAEYLRAVGQFADHDYAAAEKSLQQSVREAQSPGGTKTQESESLLLLSRVCTEEGRLQSAEEALRRAVDLLTALYGADSRPVASALLKLAACHHEQGEYPQAAPYAEQAFKIETKVVPPHDLMVAATANNLAETYAKLDKTQQAERMFTHALAVYRSNRNSEDGRRGMVDTLENLALFYRREERIDEARAAAHAAMALSGGKSPQAVADRAGALNTLAAIERAEFNYDKAAQYYSQALDLLRKSPAADHEKLCVITDNYADMALDEKDLGLAESLYKQSIEHCRRAHGDLHPMVAERMENLAELYKLEGRYSESQALLERVLKIDRLAFQSDSPVTLKDMNTLSSVYVDLKKYDRAQELYQQWMPTLVAVLGEDHPHVADALENWAMVAEKAGKSAQASQLRARAKDIRRRSEQPLAKISGQARRCTLATGIAHCGDGINP